MVLAPPLAWALSLIAMSWLTHPVCEGRPHGLITAAGIVCLLIAAVAGVLARRKLISGTGPDQGSAAEAEVAVFLHRMALWLSVMFAAVILLSLVPIAILTPCPV